MTTHVFDVGQFRAQFPAFANVTKYPDALLSGYFDMGTCYISPIDWPGLSGNCLQQALNLMTAHLVTLSTKANAGKSQSGPVSAASIDKVSVTMQPPPIKNEWQSWLATTPWGLQLWALLQVKAAGGFYVGGGIEREGFRTAGGFFGGGGPWGR